jgi:hypothetical protein
MNWLQRLESQEISEKDLWPTRNILDTPPAYLPEKEMKRVDGLKQKITKRLDENVVEQTVAYFLQIKDEKIRKQCLARLQNIMETKQE